MDNIYQCSDCTIRVWWFIIVFDALGKNIVTYIRGYDLTLVTLSIPERYVAPR